MYFLSDGLKISIDYKWYRHLLVAILEFQFIASFLWHRNSLLTVDNHTVGLLLGENILAAKTLETVHAKILFLLVLGLINIKLFKSLIRT